MDNPEVAMSGRLTPPDRSALITRLAAWLASVSAVETDDALVWTPIDRTSWFGTPLTVPVPVTVIRPPAPDAVSKIGLDPRAALMPATCPWDPARDGCADPSRNAPMSSAAAAIPIPIARYRGLTAIVMARSPGLRHSCESDACEKSPVPCYLLLATRYRTVTSKTASSVTVPSDRNRSSLSAATCLRLTLRSALAPRRYAKYQPTKSAVVVKMAT